MKLNLGKETMLQLNELEKIKGGEMADTKSLSKICLSKPIERPMPLDTPCNHAAWNCPKKPPVEPKPSK